MISPGLTELIKMGVKLLMIVHMLAFVHTTQIYFKFFSVRDRILIFLFLYLFLFLSLYLSLPLPYSFLSFFLLFCRRSLVFFHVILTYCHYSLSFFLLFLLLLLYLLPLLLYLLFQFQYVNIIFIKFTIDGFVELYLLLHASA